MELTRRDLVDELEAAFYLLKEKRKAQGTLMMNLALPEDEFTKVLSQRHHNMVDKTNAAFKQLKEMV